jgi:intraflagellar transport protein 56
METTSKKIILIKPIRKALDIYDELMKRPDYDRNIHSFKACSQYALCNFKEAK